MRTNKQKLIYYSNPNFYKKKLEQLHEIEEKVAWLLANDIQCRNDDLFLITEFWRIFDGFKAILLPLSTEQRQYMTNFESIRRTRQKLQELAKNEAEMVFLLPTDEEVIEKRIVSEMAYCDYSQSSK